MVRFRKLLPVAFVIIATGLFVSWIYPRVLYLIHLPWGGDQLAAVWNSMEETYRSPFFCAQSQPINEGQLVKLNDARRQLVDAISVLPSGSNAYLLLGRVECLVGEYEHAVQTFGTYIHLKPNNELGYIESGFANERNGDEQAALRQWRFAGLSFNSFTDVGDGLRDVGQYKESNDWYTRGSAMVGKPLDDFSGLREGENYLIESFASSRNWLPYPTNASGVCVTLDGILEMSYDNNFGKRDVFSYYRNFNIINIEQYKELIIRLKGNPSTYLTVEIVVDGERIRPIEYQPLPENWDLWQIPLTNSKLANITFSISEKGSGEKVDHHVLFVDWIALR